ncbi:MAG: hypothetical protein FJW84_03035, partial [Actinobacteria bacterium]|nr:hypothetical protein [Actinomycetota bacterium]
MIEEIVCPTYFKKLLLDSKIRFESNVPVLSLTQNNETIARMIVNHKDFGLSNIKEPFSDLIAVGLKYFSKHEKVYVVNVPSSFQSIQKRGLDPISIMTEIACKKAGQRFIYKRNLLTSYENRKDQAGLNFDQRNKNMKDVLRSDLVATKPVIIVDDLITTGASLRESIRALRQIENQV